MYSYGCNCSTNHHKWKGPPCLHLCTYHANGVVVTCVLSKMNAWQFSWEQKKTYLQKIWIPSEKWKSPLANWNRVTHICVRKLIIIGSDNGLSPGRRQIIIWTNARILLIWPLGIQFTEISIEIHILSFKTMHLNTSSATCRPFCLGLNVLTPLYRLEMCILVSRACYHFIPEITALIEPQGSINSGALTKQWQEIKHVV